MLAVIERLDRANTCGCSVNPNKSGIGRPWERKFLGFRINRDRGSKPATPSVDRFKDRVRNSGERQEQTSEKCETRWRHYVRGWWEYYRMAEDRRRS